jgi:hypothetical protein
MQLLNLWRPYIGNIVTAAMEDWLHLTPFDHAMTEVGYRHAIPDRCARRFSTLRLIGRGHLGSD